MLQLWLFLHEGSCVECLLSPYPLFNYKQFQRIFCVIKAIYKMIRSALLKHPFFKTRIWLLWIGEYWGQCQTPDGLESEHIWCGCKCLPHLLPDGQVNHVQVLWVLQWSTHRMQGIDCYLSSKNVKGWCTESVTVAFFKHGIHGMLGCLDCMLLAHNVYAHFWRMQGLNQVNELVFASIVEAMMMLKFTQGLS